MMIAVVATAKMMETCTEFQYFGSLKTVEKFSQPTHWLLPPKGCSSVKAQYSASPVGQ